jgi:transcriptional regulator with XRE-family HTH domain
MADKGLTLSQLSRISGISKPTIHGWITGRHVRDFGQLKKISLALEVSIHELLYGDADPFEIKAQEVLKEIFTGDVRVTIQRIERAKQR